MAGNMSEYNNSEQKKYVCYIDCRVDTKLSNDFLCLNIGGKPVFSYALETVRESGIFNRIVVVTDSIKIRKHLEKESDIKIRESFDFSLENGVVCIFSGRAVMVKAETVRKAALSFTKGMLYTTSQKESFNMREPYTCCSFLKEYDNNTINAFAFYQLDDGKPITATSQGFLLDAQEAVVINGVNDFELAIIIKKKENHRKLLEQAIRDRIEVKKEKIATASIAPSICLIGHSQIDFWNINELAGLKVRNCGIAGISSYEYSKYILSNNMLNCSADAFVVMHGTNDIVLGEDVGKIAISIKETIDYIRQKNENAPIYFIACMHVNGRMDRNNRLIDQLNSEISNCLVGQVIWVNTDFMDNEFGELKLENTIDGLHLSDKGYRLLTNHVEKYIIKR